MKRNLKNLLFAGAAITAASPSAFATTKALTGTELTDGASWTGGIAPGSADTAAWSGSATSLTGAQTVSSSVTWANMSFGGSNSNLTLSGAGVITLNNATGNVMSNASGYGVTINNNVVLNGGVAAGITPGLISGNQVKLNAFGVGLTLNGTLTVNGGAGTNDANFAITGTGGPTVNLAGQVNVDGQFYKETTVNCDLGNASNNIGWVYHTNGTLRAGGNGSFGSGTIYVASTGTNTATIASNGTGARTYANALDLSGTLSTAAGAITIGQTSGGTGAQTFNGGVNLGGAVRNITTNVSTTFASVSGIGGGINKAGNGTLTLTGANTFTGNTTVSTGTIALADNASLLFLIGASGTNNSILGSGTLTLDGDFTFDLSNAAATMGSTWQIVDNLALAETYTSNFSVTGFTAEGTNLWRYTNGSNIQYTFNETDGTLAVTAVPEPSVTLLGGLGILALLRRRRNA